MKVAMACDHGGFDLKNTLRQRRPEDLLVPITFLRLQRMQTFFIQTCGRLWGKRMRLLCAARYLRDIKSTVTL